MNLRDALHHTMNRIKIVNSGHADIELGVIGVDMAHEVTLSDNIKQLSCIQQEQQTALRDTKKQLKLNRQAPLVHCVRVCLAPYNFCQ